MDSEKKEYGAWWMWILFLIIISTIILACLNYAGILGHTIVERKIFENSYQKRSADEDALTTYDAQLSVLQRRLRQEGLTQDDRDDIQAQIDAINIMKSSKRN